MNNIEEINENIEKPIDKDIKKSVKQRRKPSECAPSKNKPSAQRRQYVPTTLQKRIELENPDPSMHYHLAKTSNVRRYMKAGYEVVEKQTNDQLRGTYASSQFGETATQDLGQGVEGVWMQMPLDMWKEQQTEKLEKSREIEDMIKNPGKYLQEKDPAGYAKGIYQADGKKLS